MTASGMLGVECRAGRAGHTGGGVARGSGRKRTIFTTCILCCFNNGFLVVSTGRGCSIRKEVCNMKLKKMMEDLVASGLVENPQENASLVPDPSNYVYVPLVTFYDMPEPPPLFNPPLEDDDTAEDA